MVTTPDRAHDVRPAFAGVRVVPMRRRHVRGVMAIERQVYPRHWSPALFAAEIAQPDTRRYLVAVDTTHRLRRPVIGYAGVMVTAGEAHITTVASHPHHHRRKIASRLLVTLLSEARAMGADAATLEVRVNNRGAQRLYAGFGFAPVGVRPRYYAETSEDALIMWAYDLQSEGYGALLERQRARLDQPGGDSGAADLHVPWVQGRVGLPESADPGRGR
ncbi:MAG TPA: ribosomal protein S18-alanine N-acetyltransferase [Egibacteraceae bacterium]|nr:ribosomal protein S18-alanine N-acetyltransferase [Egibacteraceae bacterium]